MDGKRKKKTAPAPAARATRFSVKRFLAQLDGPQATLRTSRALTIACHCANTVLGNLPRTLGQLGVNGLQFQSCVAQSVRAARFVISPGAIPNGPANTLIEVVNAIQDAPAQ